MRQEGYLLGLILASAIGGAGYFGYESIHHKNVAQCNGCHSSPSPAPRSPASSVVMRFYNLLGESRWQDAMDLVSPSFRGQQTVDQFAAGYATTRSIDVEVDDGEGNVVPLDMVAVDAYPDGVTRTRHFHIVWTLEKENGSLLMQGAVVKVVSDTNPGEDNVAHERPRREEVEAASDDSAEQQGLDTRESTGTHKSFAATVANDEALVGAAKGWAFDNLPPLSDQGSIVSCLEGHDTLGRDSLDTVCDEIARSFLLGESNSTGARHLAYATLANMLLPRSETVAIDMDQPQGALDAAFARNHELDVARYRKLLEEANDDAVPAVSRYARWALGTAGVNK